jgi:DNA-3-methyladenine glycosylase II
VSQEKDNLKVELTKNNISTSDLQEAKDYVITWFDMSRNIAPFYTLLKNHNKLYFLAKDYFGSRIITIPNLFEAICWAIIGQQINLTFAYKLKRLLVEKYGEKEIFDNQIYYSFPSPEQLIQADRNDLIMMKFSRQKIDYLKNISQAFLDKKISKSILLDCDNKEAKIAKLIAIKGIGVWSANYALMKSLGEMSCITYGDSGLNKAIHIIFNTEKKPSKETIDLIFKYFEGWESYLNFYLWKSLSNKVS